MGIQDVEGHIVIGREKSVIGRHIEASVSVDGRHVGVLDVSEKFTVPVPFGTHNVSIVLGRGTSVPFVATISPVSPNALLIFKTDMWGRIVLTNASEGVDYEGIPRQMNIYGLIAGVLAGIALFLPYYRIGGFGSFSLIETEDWIYFATVAGGGALAAALGYNVFSSLAGLILIALQYLKNQPLTEKTDDFWQGVVMSAIQKEEGYYLLLIAAIGLIVAGIIGIYQKEQMEKSR